MAGMRIIPPKACDPVAVGNGRGKAGEIHPSTRERGALPRVPRGKSALAGRRQGRSLHQPTTAAAPVVTGAELRIRWSKAESEALAPSPMAITICL